MKTIDLFCASPASTAILSSLDQRSTVRHGTRPIDHRHKILGDTRKYRTPIPCSSELPIDPKLYFQKSRKSSSKQSDIRRKSSADISDLATPNSSSRYLLSDTPFIDLISDSDHVRALVPSQPMRVRTHLSSDDSQFNSTKPCSEIFGVGHTLSSKDAPCLKSSSTRSRHRDQVVELRVSIHCKGCEGKVRKHISRMEGVRSFNIDLATKKVTIIGDVTPLGVLTSISRVKNAQFWPSSTSPSSSSSSSSSTPLVVQRY